ncbi:MAG: RHS repeat protein, partial [bacterium]|nr:RHS repeat protein [bacterium]
MRLWFLISSFVLVGLAAASAAVGIASNMYETEYTLDPKGNVLEAKRIEVCPAVPCPSQSRDYTYDGRGFMTRERLPEIGITGNGDVDYELDAIGQVRRKTDPRWDLRYVYDDGGRLIRVEEESGRIWKDWVWGNRVPYDAAWEERYEYRGKGSVISKVKSQLVLGGDTTGFAFAQEYSYDAFGNRITLEYPRCIAPLHLPEDDPTTCNDGDDVE